MPSLRQTSSSSRNSTVRLYLRPWFFFLFSVLLSSPVKTVCHAVKTWNRSGAAFTEWDADDRIRGLADGGLANSGLANGGSTHEDYVRVVNLVNDMCFRVCSFSVMFVRTSGGVGAARCHVSTRVDKSVRLRSHLRTSSHSAYFKRIQVLILPRL